MSQNRPFKRYFDHKLTIYRQTSGQVDHRLAVSSYRLRIISFNSRLQQGQCHGALLTTGFEHDLWLLILKKLITRFLFNCGRRLLYIGWLFFGIWIFWNIFRLINQGCLSRIFFFGNIWQITENILYNC